jgi:hypothetical protein
MKRWAVEAWERHSKLVIQVHSDQRDPLSLAALSPFAQLKNLFDQRRKQHTGGPAQAATTQYRSPPPNPPILSAKASTELGDLGSIMAKILEFQAEANLRLHQNLLDNFRVTSAAIGATGTTRDTRLSDAKLRILQAYAVGVDDGSFVPSKLYLKVNQEGGTTDTFSRILHRLVVTVPGSPHKCNVHIMKRLCWRQRR